MEVRIILFVIVGYMLYKFATRFLMPIMKITKMTSNHLHEMRQKMEHMEQKQNHQTTKRVDGDYIDYEEVK